MSILNHILLITKHKMIDSENRFHKFKIQLQKKQNIAKKWIFPFFGKPLPIDLRVTKLDKAVRYRCQLRDGLRENTLNLMLRLRLVMN